MDKRNVFDFDGTIYDGDSSIDFFLFALKKKKRLIFHIPIIIFYYILLCFHRIKKEKMKEIYFSFLKKFTIKDHLVEEFWITHNHKLKPELIKLVKEEKSCIITASPEFLVAYPFAKSKIKVIGTDINQKNGRVTGKNCESKEKIKRLKKIYPNMKIQKFYSDSKKDTSLANMSEQAFIVSKNEIIPWNQEFFYKKDCQKTSLYLFLFFFVIYIVGGILLSYHYDFRGNFDTLFDGDTSRIIEDYSEIFFAHDRLKVHPLFILLFQPIILLISGITANKILAILIFSSTVSALTVSLIYQFLSLFQKNKISKILISFIYGFSFASLVFTCGIELYNLASLALIFLWYQIAIILKDKSTKNTYYFLMIAGILSLAITITNYVVFLIASFILLLSKKVSLKKLVIINISVVLLVIGLSGYQKLIWQNTPFITDIITEKDSEETRYINFHVDIQNVKNVISNDYYNNFISSDLYVKTPEHPIIDFEYISKTNFLLITIFYLFLFIHFVKSHQKDKLLKTGFLLTLLFNTIFHFIYGNTSTFLYALHFQYSILLLFGVSQKGKSKITNSYLLFFLICMILLNFKAFYNILNIVNNILPANIFRQNLKMIPLLCIILSITFLAIATIGYFLKQCNNLRNQKEKLPSFCKMIFSVLFLSTIFIGIETVSFYWREKLKKEEAPEIIITEEMESRMTPIEYYQTKKIFLDEITKYQEYEKEYQEFLDTYNPTIYNEIKNDEFYFFGMGNRQKIIYQNGILKNVKTNKIIQKWDVKKSLIIPNLYTVLITTTDNEQIKIEENESGIWINEQQIEKRKMNLYDFSKEKFSNIKKVLYSEILFNIENGKIYPNILVYEKPWYRDAALGAMVLEYTDNVSLIEDWILELTEIYDKQNKNTKEVDNLGELLYLTSITKKKNTTLQNKILEEANKIMKEHNTKYLTGITDFENRNHYQNAWYQFGLKKIKQKNIDIPNLKLDSYSATTWWNQSCPKKATLTPNKNYPYLAWAQYHCLKKGIIFANKNLYPLSWEAHAISANYQNLENVDEDLKNLKISPTHTWSASEMLLFLIKNT